MGGGEKEGEKEPRVTPIEAAKSYQKRRETELQAGAADVPDERQAREDIDQIAQEHMELMEKVAEEYVRRELDIMRGERPFPTELDDKRFERYIRAKYVKKSKKPKDPPEPPKDPKGA